MIRTSTIVYLVLLLVLVGAYFYLRNRNDQPADLELTLEPSAEVSYLFSEETGTPSRIRIEAGSGETVELARNAENAWTVTQPDEGAANQAAAEAAASQATAMRILDIVPDVDPEIVELDNPAHVLTVSFNDGAEQRVEVGSLTPTQSGYYVRDMDGQIVIISRSSIDALLGLLDNPPYLETPTAADPSGFPTADVSATATP
jgi:hypothetical protein